jgi:hypothetical protein
VQRKLLPYAVADVLWANYEDILARLNLSTLYSRWWHLDVFKNRVSYSPLFDSVSVHIPATITRDSSLHLWWIHFKSFPQLDVFLLALSFTWTFDIFKKDYILLTDIL